VSGALDLKDQRETIRKSGQILCRYQVWFVVGRAKRGRGRLARGRSRENCVSTAPSEEAKRLVVEQKQANLKRKMARSSMRFSGRRQVIVVSGYAAYRD
jgi:hypothetical protein